MLIKKFIIGLFCEGNDNYKPCIRRIMGTFGFLAGIVALYIPAIDVSQYGVLINASVVLLGTTAIDLFKNASQKTKQEE